MTASACAAVWDSELPPHHKFILLALADGAGDTFGPLDAMNVSRKCGYDEMQLAVYITELVNQGYIVCRNGNCWIKLPGYSLEFRKLDEVVQTTEPTPKPSKRSGYIYLIQSSHNLYKIGLTRNPENRMQTFGVKLPFPVEYICLIKTDDMRKLETELHQRFASKRVNGEWFGLDAADVEYMKTLSMLSGVAL